MNALDLAIGRIARAQNLAEHSLRVKTLGDGLDTLRPFGMRDAAQMLSVEPVGYEPQPECFAPEWHGSDAALRTIS